MTGGLNADERGCGDLVESRREFTAGDFRRLILGPTSFLLPLALPAHDQAEPGQRPAGLRVRHSSGDHELGVKSDDVLPARRGQWNLAARHKAQLSGVVEHDIVGRAFPFKPAIFIGFDAEADRPVPAPGVGGEEGTGDRLALDINDRAAEAMIPAP